MSPRSDSLIFDFDLSAATTFVTGSPFTSRQLIRTGVNCWKDPQTSELVIMCEEAADWIRRIRAGIYEDQTPDGDHEERFKWGALLFDTNFRHIEGDVLPLLVELFTKIQTRSYQSALETVALLSEEMFGPNSKI